MIYHRFGIWQNPVKMTILISSLCLFCAGCTEFKVRSLIKELKDEDPKVRKEAAKVLGEMKNPLAVKPLLEILLNKEENESVRGLAARVLGEIGDPRAIFHLVAVLNDKPKARVQYVSNEAEEALIKFGPPALDLLIFALDHEDPLIRSSIARILGRIKDSRAVEPLLVALKDKVWLVKTNAARALGEIRDPICIEPLITALNVETGIVRKEILSALSNIENPQVDELLMKALKGKNIEYIYAAYSYFIRKGIENSESILVQALNEHGTQWMAQDFLDCGNRQLAKAASDWALKNRKQIWPHAESKLQWGSDQ